NTAGYTQGQSVARDNEARRLEVMANTYIINGSNELNLANTWMCAETSMINIPLDVTYNPSSEQSVNYENMNFGLALRPNTNIVLEKHITALKITPSGTGVQSIVDASKSIAAYYDENSQNDSPTGMTQGLTTIMSERNNRGFWKVETDVEELMQGAELEVEYTYVIKNDSEKDYLSNTLVEAYENQDTYNATLGEIKNAVRTTMRNGSYSYSNSNNNTIGTYLGDFYYTGNKGDNDELVSSKVNTFEEALNNDLVFNSSDATSFEIKEQGVDKKIYGVNSSEGVKDITINTVVQNELKSAFLSPGEKDDSKIIKLKATLATVSGGELGANLPSYIAEIVEYTNAAGRRNMNATPANLSYVHSNDNDMTMKNSNEVDEFWGESIIITKPTGEDKSLPLQIAIITISALATLGVGIVLIKKVVLKK
ncbi:MAG: hypothetical protein IJ272_04300, partial [Clostridia bacterium]|nr:hypothetical protein [Clostridia bacterium]